MKIPFYNLKLINKKYENRFIKSFKKNLKKSYFINGIYNNKFANDFAKYTKNRYCIGTANGFDSLLLIFKSLGIKKNDKVIVPGLTFIATWDALSTLGAKIIPVDVNYQDGCIDIKSLLKIYNDDIKAIVPVHLYGNPVDLSGLSYLKKKNKNLLIVDDKAQAHGLNFNKKYSNIIDASAYSFYPNKILGALGDGGAVCTNNKSIYNKVRLIGNYGSIKKYKHTLIGQNSRLDEIQANFLLIRLKNLDNEISQRRKIAEIYINNLSDIKFIKIPDISMVHKSVWHQFIIKCKNRDRLQKYLFSKGIYTLIHYPIPPYKQKSYKSYFKNSFKLPISDLLAKESLSLPIYPYLKKKIIIKICNEIKKYKF